jgi:uncharacterized protein (TIGR00369 family)
MKTEAETAERSRVVTWEDPMLGAAAAVTMSGLEYLQAMERGDLPVPPIARLMDFDGFHAEEGRVTFWVTPQEFHYNPIGVVHGGLAATLFDSALGCAVQSKLPAGSGYTTLELKVNFLRPITSLTGRVRCEGSVIHVGRRVATAEARLYGEDDGKLYGHASTTCLVFSAAEAT